MTIAMKKAKRPKAIFGYTVRVLTGCGNMYVTVTFVNRKPFEVFGVLGDSGVCERCQSQALTRSVTLGLRYGIPIEDYIKQLEFLTCPKVSWEDGHKISSCSDAIVKGIKLALEAELNDEQRRDTITKPD